MNPDRTCTVILSPEVTSHLAKDIDVFESLKSNDDEVKIRAMKHIIVSVMMGERMPKAAMSVIKYTLNSRDHELFKLVLLFWECIERIDPSTGKQHPEMILVCNSMKNNLEHPNEYIRGVTLRFLSKIKEVEILESLIPSITLNLSHRHSYVRKNAIQTLLAIYENCPELLPDAPEQVGNFLQTEYNAMAKHNAQQFQYHYDLQQAMQYLHTIQPTLHTQPNAQQLLCLKLIRVISCKQSIENINILNNIKKEYVNVIHTILTTSTNSSVTHQAATTLLSQTNINDTIPAAITALCTLLQRESDTNVKQLLLDKLTVLRKEPKFIPSLQECMLDIFNACSTTQNLVIRVRGVMLLYHLTSPSNIDQILISVRKEQMILDSLLNIYSDNTNNMIQQQPSIQLIENEIYRHLLVLTLHQCSIKYPIILPTVSEMLCKYLAIQDIPQSPLHPSLSLISKYIKDINQSLPQPQQCIYFLRHTIDKYIQYRYQQISHIQYMLPYIKLSEVFSSQFSILGEYVTINMSSIDEEKSQQYTTLNTILYIIDSPNLLQNEKKLNENNIDIPEIELSIDNIAQKNTLQEGRKQLHKQQLNGDLFLASTIGVSITKLYQRMIQNGQNDIATKLHSRVLHLIVSLLQQQHPKYDIKTNVNNTIRTSGPCQDTLERQHICIRQQYNISDSTNKELILPQDSSILFIKNPQIYKEQVEEYRLEYDEEGENLQEDEQEEKFDNSITDILSQSSLQYTISSWEQPSDDDTDNDIDTPIDFRQLKNIYEEPERILPEENEEYDIQKSQKGLPKNQQTLPNIGKQGRIYQQTGYSDPIYAEAQVYIRECDIYLDITLLNQISINQQNVQIEFVTSDDQKVVVAPPPFVQSPNGSYTTQAVIKAISTEKGTIQGDIVFDNRSGTDKTVILISPIMIDIIEYIVPTVCSDVQFCTMWTDFEWENKVTISSTIDDLELFLQHLIDITHMRCLSKPLYIHESTFLSTNLYAKSIFNDDALANLSVELLPNGKIVGHIRIRARTEGLAHGLGNKISSALRAAAAVAG